MTVIVKDRVKQFSTTSGSGQLTLSTVPNGYVGFSEVLASGQKTYYCIENRNEFEIGIGTYGVGGANTLSRDTVLSSSTGASLALSGRSTIFVTVPASKFPFVTESGELNLALTTLSDVSLTAPASGESLKYNGSSWVNGVVSGYTTEEAQDAVGGILADTSSISFAYDDGTPSISASVRSSGVTNDMLATGIDTSKIGDGGISLTEFGYLNGVTAALQGQLDSKYASANPSGYISASGVAAAYQPLDADLTSIASTGVDPYGIGLLTKTSASGVRDYIGAGTSSFDGAYGSLSGTPSTFAPSAHTHSNIQVIAGTGLSGGGDLSTNRTINLANTTVVPGSYTLSSFTVDAQGRITAAASGSVDLSSYLTSSVATATYQPLDADLTSLASASGSGIYERSGGNWTPVVIGTGLSLAGGALSNTLDLSGYLTSSVASATYVPLTRTLNGLALSANQTFAVGTSGTNFAISSSGTTHTFDIPDASATARGLITTGTQTIAGAKTFTSKLSAVYSSPVVFAGDTATTAIGVGGSIGLGFNSDFGNGEWASIKCYKNTAAAGNVDANLLVRLFSSSFGNIRSHTFFGMNGNLDVLNAFTSLTNFEAIRIKPNTGASYQVGSAIGSGGGTARAVSLGHWSSDGSFTSALTIETTSAVIFGSFVSQASHILELRNSTNAQTFRVYNTYTSSTSFETLQARGVAAANFQFGPMKGSAGGTLRGLTIGGYATESASITPWLTFDNTGAASFATSVAVGTGSAAKIGVDARIAAFTSNDPGTLAMVAFYGSDATVGGPTFNGYKSRGTIASPTNASAGDGLMTFGGYSYDTSYKSACQIGFKRGTGSASANRAPGYIVFTTSDIGTDAMSERVRITESGTVTFTPGIVTTGSPALFTITGPAHTTLTASTEAADVNFNLARTVQFATGALTTQRAMRIQAPTYSFVGASTITTASTLAISGPPVAGTNATITNAWAFNVESGNAYFAGDIQSGGLLMLEGGARTTKTIYQTAEVTNTPAGTTQTITLNNANHQTLSLASSTGNVTATLTVPSGSSAGTIIVVQHGTTPRDITWAVSAGTLKWMGTEPTWSSDAVSDVRIVSWRYNGSVVYLASTDAGT